MKFSSNRPSTLLLTLLVLIMSLTCGVATAADASARRKVIIDQDAFGPAGSNMQAILMLLQSKDVEVLGITIPSGDGWRDEEVSHTLRLLEIAQRTEGVVQVVNNITLKPTGNLQPTGRANGEVQIQSR